VQHPHRSLPYIETKIWIYGRQHNIKYAELA
jgi:hypothetical protein